MNNVFMCNKHSVAPLRITRYKYDLVSVMEYAPNAPNAPNAFHTNCCPRCQNAQSISSVTDVNKGECDAHT